MKSRFENKVVLITGAAGALGEAMARVFAAEGASVALAARSHHQENATRVAAEIGNDSLFVPLDVADEASWTDAVARIEDRLGPISVLVLNAAHAANGGVEKVETAQWRKSIETNLTGSFLGIRAVAPSMRRAGAGSIVIVSSVAALDKAPGLVAYGASKWGLRGLMRTAAWELARDKIRVNALHPGIIETPLAYNPDTGKQWAPTDKLAIPRNAESAEVARYVLFMASDDAAYTTGAEWLADGGFMLGPVEPS
ncbi:SDR family NAD(P)-dependent oxidoreductase [Billgrantia endophytica]|uniref:3-alpha-hydroxysteroid dehydrogenase n=1 Tax=Billgrantia endophytica TaxID=2033802 RepID=A0A2N7U5I6_9GAMM|nr:SDR family oxidoreductase [Halomonas endophytica]PMR75693.1 3-alpha-hydroxysteroid dehydrogenase [Halomonas endophytica]